MWPDNQASISAQVPYINGGAARATLLSGAMPLDDLQKALDGANQRIGQLSDRVRTIADGLFGGEPEAKMAGAGQSRPPAFGKVSGLNDQAQTTHLWLNELERQITRLGPLG